MRITIGKWSTDVNIMVIIAIFVLIMLIVTHTVFTTTKRKNLESAKFNNCSK